MKYAIIQSYNDELFRRLTGVKRNTLERMRVILEEAELNKKSLGGKPNRLSIQDRLLMALEYLGEYRTYFHVASCYGLSESTCYKNIKWIEDTLIKHPDFAFPGRKALLKSEIEYEVVLIEATESAIERPKKSKNGFIQGRKKDTP
jgi:hypothetical protein